MDKQLLIIDGSSFLYRAYYSMRPLHAPTGQAVHAVYGYCRMIKKLFSAFKPAYAVVAWDPSTTPGQTGPKTIRHELFEQYKATRQAPPSDLFEQKDHILAFNELIGLHQVAVPGVEADDLIGSLAKQYAQRGFNITVVSSDKDLCQLLNDKIEIYDPFKEARITRETFAALKGFPAEKLIFYHALVGDSSDNIPGVKGIGPKGALELVQMYDSLEHLYANLDAIGSQRAKTALQANKSDAFLSQQLFVLRPVWLDTTPEQLAFDENNWHKARPLFDRLQFTSLLKELGPEQTTSAPETRLENKYSFKTITTREQLVDIAERLKQADIFALDTETDGLDPLQCSLIGLSLCIAQGEAFYVPIRHINVTEQVSIEDVQQVLGPIFANQSYKKVLQNAKFDRLVLHTAGITLEGVAFDTMVAASLVVPDWQRVGLKALSLAYFNERMLTHEEIVEQNKYPHFAYVPLERATQYAAADAHQTFKLYKVLKQQLHEQGLANLYESIEHPLIDVLGAMEIEGIACDTALLQKLDVELSQSIAALENEIHGLVGALPGTLNLNSPKQLEQLLFHQLKLPPQKMSSKKTGYSTDQEVLEILARMHVVPRLILKYRELYKLKSTYVTALPEAVNKKTGHIHTSFNQINVATGRLASNNPNLQNIPVQDTAVTVRSAFYAPDNYRFISADYSQIELRVLAYLSQDKYLKEAFINREDIHTKTAAGLFSVAPDQVTHEQRQIGKRINFSILYGKTPFGLAKELNISTTQAKEYIDKYFAQYPAVRDWMDHVIAQTKQTGYTSTLWGRKRFLPGINEKNKSLFEAACRMAVNTWAQGTAAEIMKKGMINVCEEFKKHALDTKIILQIHDELLIATPQSEQEQAETLTKCTLESVVNWNVPLEVTLRSGKTWQDVTK